MLLHQREKEEGYEEKKKNRSILTREKERRFEGRYKQEERRQGEMR